MLGDKALIEGDKVVMGGSLSREIPGLFEINGFPHIDRHVLGDKALIEGDKVVMGGVPPVGKSLGSLK